MISRFIWHKTIWSRTLNLSNMVVCTEVIVTYHECWCRLSFIARQMITGNGDMYSYSVLVAVKCLASETCDADIQLSVRPKSLLSPSKNRQCFFNGINTLCLLVGQFRTRPLPFWLLTNEHLMTQ